MEITFIEQQQLLVEFSGEKYANRFVGVVNVDNDMFTIPEFIQYTGYDINQLYVNKFWNMLNQLEHDDWVYMTEELYEEFGYSVKHKLNLKIKERCGFVEFVDYIEYTYNDVINDENLANFFGVTKKRGYANMSFFKFTKQSFKMLLLSCNAKKEFIKYYIKLEELFTDYLKYQTAYTYIKETYRLKTILNINTDNRIIDVKSDSLKEHFVIIQFNNDQDTKTYTIMCGQTRYIKNTLKMYSNSNRQHSVLLDHTCYLNSKNLYCRIREKVRINEKEYYETKIHIKGRIVRILSNMYTIQQFIQIVHELDEDKRIIPI